MPVEEGETTHEGYGARFRGLYSSTGDDDVMTLEQYDFDVSDLLTRLREEEAAASTPYPNYYTEFFTSEAGLAMRDAAVKGLPDPYISDEGGHKEMTEKERQAYINVWKAVWGMQANEMEAASTPYPVNYEGHHDASTPYPVSFKSDEGLERHSSTYTMGYNGSKPVCPQGQAPLILYLDSGSTGGNKECRQADGQAAFYFTAFAGDKGARTLTLPVTTTPTTTATTTTDPTLEPDLSGFTLLQILDLGCQPPSNVLEVELRNELMPDVVCSRWTVPGWAKILYQEGTSVTLGGGKGGGEVVVASPPALFVQGIAVGEPNPNAPAGFAVGEIDPSAPVEEGGKKEGGEVGVEGGVCAGVR